MEANKIDFAAMPQTAVRVITAPTDFFKEMPKTGGFLEPLVFAVIMGLVAGLIQAIWSFVGFGYGGGMRSGLWLIIAMPIGMAIGSFIGAAILFVIWKLMGSQEEYEVSYRCVAYLAALAPITAVLGVIPYAGHIINMAIFVFYIVIASTQVHNIPSQKAWLVFGIIGIVFVLFGIKGEYNARNMSSAVEQWRRAGEETAKAMEKSAKDLQKSSGDMQKQAEEMAKQLQKQAEEAQRRAAEQNK